MASNAVLASVSLATGCVMARAPRLASCAIAPCLALLLLNHDCHSGWSTSAALYCIQLAKPSLSQRSFHQAVVTRLPNHWCAISCASSENTRRCVSIVLLAGSYSRPFSKNVMAPQCSIALELLLGSATRSSLGSGYFAAKYSLKY